MDWMRSIRNCKDVFLFFKILSRANTIQYECFGTQSSQDSSNKCIYICVCMYKCKCVKMMVSTWHTRANLTLEYQGASSPAEHPCDFSSSWTWSYANQACKSVFSVSRWEASASAGVLPGPCLLKAVRMLRKPGEALDPVSALWPRGLRQWWDTPETQISFCWVEVTISPLQGPGGHQIRLNMFCLPW